ncbi:hypothetical protein IG631_10112 [Alternaria alternata]|nr:hypothetical protein IG631_10112 [Alternaria alternata]
MVTFCPGPRHRDKGYRNENGDRTPQRSDADWSRCAKIPSDAEQRESLKRPGNGKGLNANAVGIQCHAAIIDNAVNQSAMS